MYSLLFILIYIIFGFFFTEYIYDISNITATKYFDFFSSLALGIGLYGSVYGIEIEKFKQNLKIVFSVITIGVVLKILIIGTLLYLITGNIISFFIATILAQIDPLSVASLEKNKLSKDGQVILRAWSSFDDPMTIIIAIWLSFLFINNFSYNTFFIDLLKDLGINILFAIIVYIVYKLLLNKISQKIVIIILLFIFLISIVFKLFLNIALIALFLRPKIEYHINIMVKISLAYVSFIMGVLIANGINLQIGFLAGLFTILSQIVITFLLTKKLDIKDRIRLAFAQQSGITAITLAVYFSNINMNLVSTIAVAIIVINIGYFILNKYVEFYLNHFHERI